jgi:hypothetical protein
VGADLPGGLTFGRGHVVQAKLTAVSRPRKPINAALLRSLTAAMPAQSRSAADLVRSMRDGGRR